MASILNYVWPLEKFKSTMRPVGQFGLARPGLVNQNPGQLLIRAVIAKASIFKAFDNRTNSIIIVISEYRVNLK